MHFGHSEEIWREFPRLVPGLLLVEGIDPGVELQGMLSRWFERAEGRLRERSESEMPEIAAWRRAYSQMGLKPTKYRSAAEALLRRFKREGNLPRLHPLIDACNAVSLAYALPVAVFDLAKVEGYLEVRKARGDEEYLAFSGEVEVPPAGEVIFADAAKHAHARRWTFRQSRRSTVSADTRRALIVSEGLHDAAGDDIPALLDALSEIVTKLWQSPSKRAVLSAEAPLFEID
jgi:DNA/RNA-binding domain of Phe-tRNA-synthetase-like protein